MERVLGKRDNSERDLIALLRDSEARYRALAELSPDAVWVDYRGRIVYANASAARVMAADDAEALIGIRAIDVVIPADRSIIAERINHMLEHGGRVGVVETRWRRLDGVIVDVESAASRIPWARGSGIQVVFRDVTERTRADAALRESEARDRTAEREEARHRLVAAEEEERRRLARELHDEAGQHLTALGLGIEALSHVTHPGSEIDRRAGQLRKLAQALATDIHSVATRLRPRALDDFGLEAAIAANVDEWVATTGIQVDVHTHLGGRLTSIIESSAYRIVQEALTNIARHSGATFASVILERREGSLVVVVEDNGRGFDATALERRAVRSANSLGLRGIRERAELLDGTLDIESFPGKGTTLYVRVPLTASRPHDA